MEGDKDELLQYFAEEYRQFYQKYNKRLTIQELKTLSKQDLKTHFQFLSSSDPTKPTQKEFVLPTIIQIRGDRMRSVVDNQIYGIFCQAPSKWNSKNFWSICYKEKVSRIFMLCADNDDYLPKRNEELIFQQENISVRSLWEEPVNRVLNRRPIIITGPNGEHKLEHLHFTGWRDGGIPEGQECEDTFRNLADEAINTIDNKEMIVVHCIAGLGRTGTFGAVVEAVRCFRKSKATSLFQITTNMRKDRCFCIGNFEQFEFANKQAQILSSCDI